MENVKNQLFLDPSNIWIVFDHKGVILRGINTFMDDDIIKVTNMYICLAEFTLIQNIYLMPYLYVPR